MLSNLHFFSIAALLAVFNGVHTVTVLVSSILCLSMCVSVCVVEPSKPVLLWSEPFHLEHGAIERLHYLFMPLRSSVVFLRHPDDEAFHNTSRPSIFFVKLLGWAWWTKLIGIRNAAIAVGEGYCATSYSSISQLPHTATNIPTVHCFAVSFVVFNRSPHSNADQNWASVHGRGSVYKLPKLRLSIEFHMLSLCFCGLRARVISIILPTTVYT